MITDSVSGHRAPGPAAEVHAVHFAPSLLQGQCTRLDGSQPGSGAPVCLLPYIDKPLLLAKMVRHATRAPAPHDRLADARTSRSRTPAPAPPLSSASWKSSSRHGMPTAQHAGAPEPATILTSRTAKLRCCRAAFPASAAA